MSGESRAHGGFRAFLALWASQTLSLFGTTVTQFAVSVWLVRDVFPDPSQKPQLALALSATGLASAAPLIFAMPIAGAFADRHDRRRILIAANTAQALLTALLVALALSGHLTLTATVAALALYAVCGSFHSAAFDSAYGRFVDAEHLPRASGMMMTSYSLAQMFAPPLAAALVGLPALLAGTGALPPWLHDGVPFAFAADGLTFVVAAVTAALLRFPPAPQHPEGGHAPLWASVREGFHWILTRRPFLWMLSLGGLANLTFAALILLLPLLARDRVAADAALRGLPFEAVLALVNTAGGVGGLLGGITVSALGIRARRKTLVMAVCMSTLGLGQVVCGLSTTVVGLAAGMFLGELLLAPLNAASYTLWQGLTPPHLLARALATRRFISQSAFPVGTALAGWLAAGVEPWLVVTVSGALLVLYSAALIASPGFRGIEGRMREAAARPD